MRLTVVQYAGDYREAWQRLSAGGKETYFAQRYSVDFLGELAGRIEGVSIVVALTGERYDEVLGSGVRSIGVGLSPGFDPKALLPLIEATRPTHLLLATPLRDVLRWAQLGRVRTLAMLADSFQSRGLRSRLRNRLLARDLNRDTVDWVGNHGVNACRSLAGIGVSPGKLVPWDWPRTAAILPPRQFRAAPEPRLLYVGAVSEAKGVGDLIAAAGLLRDQDVPFALDIVGHDADGRMQAKAGALPGVRFVGVVGNDEVPALMRAADIVVIPSRHEYPEGLPLTIYEALTARTPIVASDHPMFRGVLEDGRSAAIFPAGDAAALAGAIRSVATDEILYARLSANAATTLDALRLPVEWGSLIGAWMSDRPDRSEWLRAHSIASGIYDRRTATATDGLLLSRMKRRLHVPAL